MAAGFVDVYRMAMGWKSSPEVAALGTFDLVKAEIYSPGAVGAEVYKAGSAKAEVYLPGASESEVAT